MHKDTGESSIVTDKEIPKLLRYTMLFIDRVGFPIVAFLIMAYMCFVTIQKNTEALGNLTEAVKSLRK